MNLLAPAALALVPPLLGSVIVLYMLKLRREDRRVPSTMLWRMLAQDPPANAPWQRLRRNMLLALQLLFLGLLILALARPFVPTDGFVGRTLIVLLDRSATMAATDVAPTRLEAAKEAVLRLVDEAAGARITVIAFDDDFKVLAAGQTDVAAVRAAVRGVVPMAVRANASDAFAFAGALAEGQPDAQIVVFSDGRFELAPEVRVTAPIRFVPLGHSDDNQAITALSIDGGSGGRPAELFAQVANAARVAASRRVEIRVDGALVDARDVALLPGERAGFSLALPDGIGVAEARLAGADALPLDDAAWAVWPRLAQAQVALVSDGNRFLEAAIGLLPSVASVTRVGSEAMEGPFGLTDVAVLDGLVPDKLPPGNLLIAGPTSDVAAGDSGSVGYAGTLDNPVPRVLDAAHPLAAGIAWSEVAVLSSAALTMGSAWSPVVVADVDGRVWPLVAQGTVEGRTAVLVAFDLRQSDLPLRPAFPLFTAAAMEVLAPSSLAGVPTTAAPGELVRLRLPSRATAVRVIGPDGGRHDLALDRGAAVFAATELPGAYAVEVDTDRGKEVAMFAVNVTATDPLDIRPAGDTALSGLTGSGGADDNHASGGAAASGVVTGGVGSGAVAPTGVKGRRELWWPIGLACLVLLSVEWAYDHRAVVRREIDRARGGM